MGRCGHRADDIGRAGMAQAHLVTMSLHAQVRIRMRRQYVRFTR
jgi:hypothetical protein